MNGSLTRHINSATAVRIPQRPDRHNLTKEEKKWDAESRHWLVTLTHKLSGRFMSLFFSQGSAYKNPPTAEDVLDSLAMDASDPEDNFEEWASNLGYDPDSRKAEPHLQRLPGTDQKLQEFIGTDAYNKLLNEVERL